MVFNRLCDPGSKLGVLRWLETVALPQKFDTFLEKFRFLHPGLLMNSRTYLNFQVQSKKRL
jgi:hypothetical protein